MHATQIEKVYCHQAQIELKRRWKEGEAGEGAKDEHEAVDR